MDLSIFLAKIMGAWLVIMGIAILAKPKVLMSSIAEFRKSKFLQFLTGSISLVIGLLIVSSHNLWSAQWHVTIITVLGWIILLKGAIGLLLPEKAVDKIFEVFNNKTYYMVGSIIWIIVGLYLLSVWYATIS